MADKLSVDIEKSSLTNLVDTATEKFLKCMKATEADGWAHSDTTDGLEVAKYSPIDGSATNGLARGRITVNVPGELAWRFVIDPRNNMAMDSFCTSVELLQKLGPELYIYRLVYSLPWPITPREILVVYSCKFVDPKSRLTLYTSIPEEFVPLTPGFVRADSFGGIMSVSNEANTSCELTSITSADLKGMLPSYLVNSIINRRPYLMSKVRELLESYDPKTTSKYFFMDQDKLPKQ